MLFQHAANSSMNRINTLSYAPRNLGKLSVLGNERKRTGMRKIGELTAQLRFLEELKRSQELRILTRVFFYSSRLSRLCVYWTGVYH